MSIVLNDEINIILADWNPLSIDGEIAKDEYKSYVLEIIHNSSSFESLKSYLESVLKNEMGLEYDSQNPEHLADLEDVCKKILGVIRKYRI